MADAVPDRLHIAMTDTTSRTTTASIRATAPSAISSISPTAPSSVAFAFLIDLVVNHTSDQHPWFKEARRDPTRSIATGMSGRRRSRERRRAAWCFRACRRPPGLRRSAKAYYFHRFYDFQPDLNTSQPGGPGRDPQDHGFLDSARRVRLPHGRRAVRHRHEGPEGRKPKEQYDMLRAFREFLQWRQGDCIVLAEANVCPRPTWSISATTASACT
jgi:maltose alpha-D-glucosyltransferase/alpha-amylase